MARMVGPVDDDQQDSRSRNLNLARLLNSGWANANISTIGREPPPTNPPDLNGSKQGQWTAETAD